ncbi:MAG: toll/interleukin-1 receptor domain-containing protein [Bacteroidetes bacterium]|nr:toll/interleukin-1 receptor domain-containing protein [Bacteroidota bacterium]MBP6722389.1 toll/interleukin-1 receptor domain-containing protein [Bacteroidia bacterium]
MRFENDVMISYAWRDNQPPPMTKQEGWVSAFQSALEYWLKQLLARPVKVWRDKNQMPGNKIFAEELDQVVADCAILLTVISEPYLSSEWCARELDNFVKAAETQGGLQVDNNYRIFKINKFPVNRNSIPQRLSVVTGFDFFEQDPDSRVTAPIDPSFGDAKKEMFIRKVYDVAVALAQLLKDLESKGLKPGSSLPENGTNAGERVHQPVTLPVTEAPPAVSTTESNLERKIFILHTEEDKDAVRELRKGFKTMPLAAQSVTLTLPVFEGDAATVAEINKQRLLQCDAVIVFWGNGGETWLQSTLDELRSVISNERNAPFKADHLVYVAGKGTNTKADYLLDFEDGLISDGITVVEGIHEVPHSKLIQFVQSIQ